MHSTHTHTHEPSTEKAHQKNYTRFNIRFVNISAEAIFGQEVLRKLCYGLHDSGRIHLVYEWSGTFQQQKNNNSNNEANNEFG